MRLFSQEKEVREKLKRIMSPTTRFKRNNYINTNLQDKLIYKTKQFTQKDTKYRCRACI